MTLFSDSGTLLFALVYASLLVFWFSFLEYVFFLFYFVFLFSLIIMAVVVVGRLLKYPFF